MRTSAKILGAMLLVMLVAVFFIWYAALAEDTRGELTISFLNVGQGDATFIALPNGRRVLVDGGPDDSVLRQLGSVLPFYDRTIDVVIATAETPQEVGGLTSVIERYRVVAIVRSAARSSAPQVQAFDGAVATAEEKGSRLIVAQRGTVIDLGSTGSPQAAHTFIEVFFPDRDASNMAPSDGCLAFKLVYGKTAFFFACGSEAIENYLATLDGVKLKSDVLFATGNEPELFAGFVSPQYEVMPCGSSATSSIFAKLQIQTLNTCDGNVTFISDGQTVERQ